MSPSTPAPPASRSSCRSSAAPCCGSPTTGGASTAARATAAWASPGCASGRCWWAAASMCARPGARARRSSSRWDDPMRILIADDHGIVRSGLRLLLDRQPDMRVVAEASDGAEAVELALRERPDLCILDVGMPVLTGLQATREIKSHAPDVTVLMLSMHSDERYLFEALKAGASGYVLKAEADQALVAAARAVGRGEAFLTNAAERSLIRDWMDGDESAGPREPLTPREQEVVKLIAEAHTNTQIA